MGRHKSFSKRILSIVLSMVMVLSMMLDFPGTTFSFARETYAAEGTDAVTLSAVAGNPLGNSNEEYTNLFDGNTGTKWCGSFNSSAYVIFKASEPVKVSKYSIATASDTSSYTDRNPVAWTLSACMNYEELNTTWTKIDNVTEGGLPNTNETSTDFTSDDSTTYYQYFKLEITQLNGGNILQISEFALKEYTICKHEWGTGTEFTPTCSEDGYTLYSCSICGITKREPTEDALGHDFVDEVCTRCSVSDTTPTEPSQDGNGVYQIGTAGELYWFANKVNSGSTGINAVLTADITVNRNVLNSDGTLGTTPNGTSFTSWTPIGDSGHQYYGTFDGGEHTVSGLYVNDVTKSDVGLFGYIYKGSVVNVGIKDSYFKGSDYVGGVCGYADCYTGDYGSITNCYNTGTVYGNKYVGGVCGYYKVGKIRSCYNTGKVYGEEYVGGVCGCNDTNSGYVCGSITNCYNTGDVRGNGIKVGGVCGAHNSNVIDCYNTGTIIGQDIVGGVCGHNMTRNKRVAGSSTISSTTVGTITNSYNTGDVRGDGTKVGGVCGYNETGTNTNCYSLEKDYNLPAVGANEGWDSSQIIDAQLFSSGKICYLLNGKNDVVAWRQTIGTDASPVLDQTHSRVYASEPCPVKFSNESIDTVEHNYGEDGICTACDDYIPAEDTDGDSYYEIRNAGQLYWFAKQVNSGNNSIRAVLTADITVNENVLNADGTLKGTGFRRWVPIMNYSGKFNGNNYTISGLYCNEEYVDYVGFFGSISNGYVRNVGIVDSYFNGKGYVGGVCGFSGGRVSNGLCYSGNSTVENCYNTSTIIGKDLIGGVCGTNSGSTITNCYNTGAIIGQVKVGGVCASNHGAIKNCYNIGDVSGEGTDIGNVCGYSGGTIMNCYSLEKENGMVGVGAYASSLNTEVKTMSANQFKSGYVCYLLNDGDDVFIWRQTIGKDDLPVLDQTHSRVYASEPCPANCTNNRKDLATVEHDIENGFCKGCDKCDIPEQTDGIYQLENAAHLYWFANQVNEGQLDLDAVLVNDITVNPGVMSENTTNAREWISIGKKYSDDRDKLYSGTFDGQGHTISGLYFNNTDTTGITADYVGLFGNIGPKGKICNVGIINSYFCGYIDVGGVCGYSCGTITNCYNTSTVKGTYDGGGICAVNYGTVANCYNTGAVSAKYSGGDLVGSNDNGTMTNCYYLADTADDNGGRTAEQFNSGEVAYLLYNGKNGDVWGQDLSDAATKTMPKLNAPRVYKATLENEAVSYHNHTEGTCGLCEDRMEPELLNCVYQIGTKEELYWFADYVNGGNPSANAVLTADIIVNNGTVTAASTGVTPWTPIGSESNVYIGTFDGQGHTISGLYVNNQANDAGLFGRIGEGGSISNVGVKNSYFNGASYVGGICGRSESGTIANCYTIDINSGLCTNNSGSIINCYSIGSENGICANNSGSIINCYSIGAKDGICANNSGTIEYCYYPVQVIKEDNNSGKTEEQFHSGEVAYILSQGCYVNGITYDGSVWGQDLSDEAGYPTLNGPKVYNSSGCKRYTNIEGGYVKHTYDESGICIFCGVDNTDPNLRLTVNEPAQFPHSGKALNPAELVTADSTGAMTFTWKSGDTILNDNPKEIGEYQLIVSIEATRYYEAETKIFTITITADNHTYDEKGVCSLCGANQSADVNSEGYYEIGNAGQLYWFAEFVNGGESAANAVLTDNIIVNGGNVANCNGTKVNGWIDWTPINNYKGTFDGQGHTVSGLYFNNTDKSYVGLFGSVESGGKVLDVCLANSYLRGYDYVGGISGKNAGTITNCYNNGTVAVVNRIACAGGICGYNEGTITNCYNIGNITTEGRKLLIGGVCGYSEGSIANCYYLDTTQSDSNATAKTEDQFSSGEVAYLLSQGCMVGETNYDGSVWGQLIGYSLDAYPVLENTYETDNKVYQYTNCEGNKLYTNDSALSGITQEHDFSAEKMSEAAKFSDATCSQSAKYYYSCTNCDAVDKDDKRVFDSKEYLPHSDSNEDGVCDECSEIIDAYMHLQTLIDLVKDIQQGDYSDASYQALQTALREAKALMNAVSDDGSGATYDELIAAYDKLDAAKNGLKTATVTVTASSEPANSGILTGGGKYAVGETVTLTAKAVSGYKFLGWYLGDAESAESTNTTYEVTVTESTVTELNYIAKYVANESKKLSVTVGDGTVAYSYQNGVQTGTWNDSFTDTLYTKGTYFTLTAQPKDGYTFLYWINDAGRVLTESKTYSFYLGDDLKLEACYKQSAPDTHYVIFKDMNGKVLLSRDVDMNQTDESGTKYGTVEIPSHGIFAGYTFSCWKDAEGNVISEAQTGTVKITEDIVIYADYEAVTGLTLTVDGVKQNTTYDYASKVTVTADESKDSKYFSGWYMGDKLVSDSMEYTFYITENTSLTAKYEGESVIVQNPLVNMTMSDRTTLDDGKQTLVMNVTWSVPEGYTFVEGGLVRSLVDEYSDKLTLTDVDGTNVKKNVSKLTTAEGTYAYTLTLSTASVGKNVYAVGYITYKNDATGEVTTIYTDKFTSTAVSSAAGN